MLKKQFTSQLHDDGTVQELRRRTPGGTSLPIGQTGRTWQDIVAPAPAPTGGASAAPDHPSRKHDVAGVAPRVFADIVHDTSGVRRRARRARA